MRDHHHLPTDGVDHLFAVPVTRRTVLGGLGLGALGILVPGLGFTTRTGATGAYVAPSAAEALTPYRLAMHVHASFSEGVASMYASLREAQLSGHDLVFFTDHDWRKKGFRMRQGVHFSGPAEVESPSGTWSWSARTEGSPVSPAAPAWVTTPSSPIEPGHALAVTVTAPASGTAASLMDGNDASSSKGGRTNVVGQRIGLDLRVQQPSAGSWLELRCYLSYYPALGGYPKGFRTLVYRFGTLSGDERSGLTGIVWKPVPAATWVTVELVPFDDITRLFPELPVPSDAHLTARSAADNVVLTVGAVARDGATTQGWFDRLRYTRTVQGSAAYDLEEQIITQYAGRSELAPARLGDEISRNDPHLNWLTGRAEPIDFDLAAWPAPAEVVKVIDAVHAHGALLQYNHPFGADAQGTFTDQDALLSTARSKMLSSGAWPLLDLLETGYQQRGEGTSMASLDTHLRLFDLMARAGRFVTATGCTDDHEGIVGTWSTRTNRYATGILAPSLADADVATALARGRAWCTEVQSAGTVELLDLTVDGIAPMGSVSIATKSSRSVQLTCPVVPAGARAEFVQGSVDYRNDDLTHLVTTFATATAAELGAGTVARSVATSSDSFVRVQVRAADGRIVAFSNPIWLLRAPPPGACPTQRLAPDTPSCGLVEPDTVVTTPAANATLTSPVTLTGTATDDTGIARVRYAIRNQTTKLWLRPDGTFGPYTTFDATLATPNAPTTTWTATTNLPPGTYGLDAYATDTTGTTETTKPWVAFTVTATAPVEPDTVVTTPAANATLTSPVTLTGTATDDTGIARVRYAIRNQTTKLWLRPDGTFGPYTTFDATLATPNAPTTTWTATTNLPPGTYGLDAYATDTTGTTETTKPWVAFTVTATAPVEPDTVVTTPAANATLTSPVTLTGTATDDTGIARVRYAIRNQTTKLWLRPDGTFGPYTTFDATLATPNAPTTTWTATTNLPPGTYGLDAYATDTTGTTETTKPWVAFTVR